MTYSERLKPRSFTGLSDEEWVRFGKVICTFLGSGKRSLFICTLVRKTNDHAMLEFAKNTDVVQRADHVVNDAAGYFGVRDLKKPHKKLDGDGFICYL